MQSTSCRKAAAFDDLLWQIVDDLAKTPPTSEDTMRGRHAEVFESYDGPETDCERHDMRCTVSTPTRHTRRRILAGLGGIAMIGTLGFFSGHRVAGETVVEAHVLHPLEHLVEREAMAMVIPHVDHAEARVVASRKVETEQADESSSEDLRPRVVPPRRKAQSTSRSKRKSSPTPRSQARPRPFEAVSFEDL